MDNFQRLFFPKNQQITFKVAFVANGQLLALITPGMASKG
jgi:hypothetical protein